MMFYFVFCILLSLYYLKMVGAYLKGWLKTTEVHTKKNIVEKTKVSILVAARNEEKYIEKCLLSLTNQTYDNSLYEIIVLDDFSEDKTVAISKTFSKVKVLQLSDFLGKDFKEKANKKRAITLGVKNASYDIIITTDADCFYGENWLKAMVQKYERHEAKLITAPVVFNAKNGLISSFLALDLISLMGITCGSIRDQKPNMINGANMLFEKRIFNDVNGYKDNENIPSGDDVFLMQKINKKYNNSIYFLKNFDAIAYTNAPSSFKEFVNQRIRWTSKSVLFADMHVKKSLFLSYLFYLFSFLNLFVFSFFHFHFFVLGIVMFLTKIILDAVFFKNLLNFFKNDRLFNKLILIELIHLIYIVILGILSLYGKYSWKDRKL